jgi:hypothetical protein
MFERVLEQEAEEYGYESAKPKIEPAKVEKKAATATVPTHGRAVAKPGARTTRSELLAKIEADDLT